MVYTTLKNIKFIITANTRTLSKQIILNNYDFNQKYQTMIIIGGSLKVQMYRFNQKNYEPPGPSPSPSLELTPGGGELWSPSLQESTPLSFIQCLIALKHETINIKVSMSTLRQQLRQELIAKQKLLPRLSRW